MERKRATRIAMFDFGAREITVGGALVAGLLALAGCDTLPGFGSQPAAQPVVQRPTLRVPPPPPARPRVPNSAAARFRTDILEPAPGAPAPEVLAAPAPPPVPRGATSPTVGVETLPTTPPTPPPVAPTPPRLLDDSAASEVARTEPAAPAGTQTDTPPPSIEPATLLGATTTMLRDRFGGPESQNPIASGMSWHYDRAACKASFVLLPELNSGALRVFSYEITPREGAMFGPAGCLGRIAATRAAGAAGTVQ